VIVNTVIYTDVFGNHTTQQIIVEARDPAQMDQMFRAIWNGMNNALIAGDKDGAMRYLNGTAQRKFGPAFDALMPFMPDIVASYSVLARSSITPGIGEYAVVRTENGQKRLYLIYFMLGADGVWRIDEM
jgi:PAS domain-containing protein